MRNLHYVRFLPVALICVANGLHAQIHSDSFSGTSVASFWSQQTNNSADTISESGGFLTIDASTANGGSDWYYGSNYNAPLLFQTDSNLANFNWTASVDLTMPTPIYNYSGAGIFLASEETAGAISPDLSSDGANLSRFAGWEYGVGNPPTGVDALEITKVGDVYTAYYSTNGGATWIQDGQQTLTGLDGQPITTIGLYALDQGWNGPSPDTQAEFSNFVFTPANAGVPDGCSTLWLAAAGLAALVFSSLFRSSASIRLIRES